MLVSFYVVCKHISISIVYLKNCEKIVSEIHFVLKAVKPQECGVVSPINMWDAAGLRQSVSEDSGAVYCLHFICITQTVFSLYML